MIRHCVVHVWIIDLNPPGLPLEPLQSILSSDERQRVEQQHFAEHRRRSTVALAQRRAILSRYLNVFPERIRFSIGPYGKPCVADSKLHFNVSHSQETAVLALCEETDVGVDIEYCRLRKNLDALVNRVFSPCEQQQFQELPKSQQLGSFYQTWTCKEAFVKAIGKGLVYPLSGIEVEVDPRKSPRLLHAADDDINLNNFALQGLDISAHYSAHLVAAARNMEVRVNMRIEGDSYSFRQTQSCC